MSSLGQEPKFANGAFRASQFSECCDDALPIYTSTLDQMGVELHITRAEFWADNEDAAISPEEWLAYVAADPELTLRPESGRHFHGHAVWIGPSKYEEPWLHWSSGNISTKWPDTALYRKMLRIAAALNAQIQDDDGEVYTAEADWSFDPTEHKR